MEHETNRKQNIFLMLVGSGLVLIAIAAFFTLRSAQGVFEAAPADAQIANAQAVPIVVHFSAPDIRLTDLQGQPVAFSDYKGQVILYNAWATWCPPCKEEMPVLEAYYQLHKQDGFVVIAIEDGEPVDEVAAYVKEKDLTFPVWPDPKWVATEAFGINHLPTSYVIDRAGMARLTWVGAITREALEQYVTPLLKEP